MLDSCLYIGRHCHDPGDRVGRETLGKDIVGENMEGVGVSSHHECVVCGSL